METCSLYQILLAWLDRVRENNMRAVKYDSGMGINLACVPNGCSRHSHSL